jgi:hypothetical protein
LLRLLSNGSALHSTAITINKDVIKTVASRI